MKVKRRSHRDGRDVCAAVQAALAELDANPERARCIAKQGQQLARSLTMERVYAYMAGVLRRAAAAQQPEVVQRQMTATRTGNKANVPHANNVVTKRNLLRHVSASTRPWIERIFLPANGVTNGSAGAPSPKRSFAFSR